MRFQSTKNYGHAEGLSCVFRQPGADSHCRFLHGYSLAFKFVFGCQRLDSNGWVVDFGSLRDLKQYLKDRYDHTLLVDREDPMLAQLMELERSDLASVRVVEGVGVEMFAADALCEAQKLLTEMHGTRCQVVSVECSEHGANSAIAYAN